LPDVEGLILDRVARLEERARHLVPWAAALGHNFSPEILRLASGLAPAELVGAVEELERRGILCSSPPAPATYDFTHDLIRRAVYGQLSDPRRRVVHLQLARTLSTMPDPDAALAGDVAHHASLGGDAELAARAAVAAGDRSLRMFAWTEAYALAEHGMRHAAQLPRDTRIRLHMALLKVAVHASIGAPGARSLDEDVSRLTIEAQDAGLAAEVATGYYLLSFRHHVDGNFAAAHDDTLRAAEAGRQEDSAVAARTLANSGRCLALIERDMPKARAMLTEAQQLAGSSCLAIVDISWGLGLVRAFDGAYDDAVRLLESAVMLARREQDHWAECQALQRLALIEFERRDPAAARDRARQFAAVALKMGEGSEAPFAAVLEALANVSIDDPDADKAVADALTALRAVDAKALLSHALSLAAAMDLERGDVDRARLRAEEALAAAEVVGRRSEIVMALIVLARAARQKGDAAAVSRYARAASTNLQDPSSVASHVRQAARILSGR
jgi:predicted ATPase